ncbi:hypothetical protein ACI7BZ_05150 [Xanthobacter sp. AM11]|uniref:hypothetical protein n=1 Tax=Xanthobacter sp. AM11 TaxID=3380643 RepID=UPI0039BFD0D5
MTISEQGKYGHPGFSREFFGSGSLAIPISQRGDGERLSWHDIGLIHDQHPHAFPESYKPADIYQYRDGHDLGLELVLAQHFVADICPEWHLHQDFVIAFGLLREGDSWVCPSEAFLEVAKLKRDQDGRPSSLEVRAEFLRDYLAARHMALRIVWYRERIATTHEANFISWPEGNISEETAEERFEGRCWQAGEGGLQIGSGVAVFRVWRTDVDDEIDVPFFGPESDDNTDYESHSFTRDSDENVFMIQGEVWRAEWLEPGAHSPRIRGDIVAPSAFFITDASGTKESRTTLKNEDVGKYLWFRSGIISELLHHRGSSLVWHTADTGSVRLTADVPVHFGMNRLGLINVYAYDIAKLPDWQQHIWTGYNVTPEGGVSEELLAAQMRAQPASTIAPEKLFAISLSDLNDSFTRLYGRPFFREHSATQEVLRSVHRFRATDDAGLLGLAKDIARLTADSIDTSELNKMVSPPKGEKWGSLKSLEKFLSKINPKLDSRKILSQLVGIYELRLGDAHLPSNEIENAFELARIDRTRPTIFQGAYLIMAAAWTLHRVSELVSGRPDPELQRMSADRGDQA